MGRIRKNLRTRYTVALVGDGETERLYFSNVQDADRPDNISIYPAIPKRIGNFKGVLARAIELKEEDSYDRVYALIDMDAIIRDGQQRRRERRPERAYSRL